MSENPATRWYWNDWDNDRALRLCSLAAQGLWMRMLSIAARAGGYLRVNNRSCGVDDIAALVGSPLAEVAPLIEELASRGVFSRTRDGTIYNRRMVRDEKKRKTNTKNGKKGGNPALLLSAAKKRDNPASDNREDKPPDKAEVRESVPPLYPIPYTHKEEEEGDAIASPMRARASPGRDFSEWWSEWPHKVAKRDAERAYRRALDRASAGELIAGVRRYVAAKPRDRPWCNPATWLNGDRWLDEPADEPAERVNGHAIERGSAIENLFRGADRAAAAFERREGNRGDRDAAVGPLLDRE